MDTTTLDFSINLSFIYVIVAILGGIALIYLILVLKNILKITSQLSQVIEQNTDNLNQMIQDATKITDNVASVSDSAKDISDVVTDTTADLLLAKDRMQSNMGMIADILQIVKEVFFSKKN